MLCFKILIRFSVRSGRLGFLHYLFFSSSFWGPGINYTRFISLLYVEKLYVFMFIIYI
jgi:hypothetical protein